MIDPNDMTDDEFMEFINASKDRIEMLMGHGGGLRTQIKENAKKAKAKAESANNAVEDSVKKVFGALFSSEVQKHMVSAGIELMLGFNAIIKAMPVPDKAQPVIDKVSEIRKNAKSAYCAKNPDCPKKKAAKNETKKIELD